MQGLDHEAVRVQRLVLEMFRLCLEAGKADHFVSLLSLSLVHVFLKLKT